MRCSYCDFRISESDENAGEYRVLDEDGKEIVHVGCYDEIQHRARAPHYGTRAD